MRQITTTHLAALVDQLSERDRAILADLEHTRVPTGAHLQRLHFTHIDTTSRAQVSTSAGVLLQEVWAATCGR